MPTLTDPALAPPGCETFYVLAPVPHLGAPIDWEPAARPFRDRVMGSLEDHYLPDLSRHLVTEHMIDPRHFRDVLNSYLGAAFSFAPVLTQSAWFRPHNRSQELPTRSVVGAGTHPGAGLPGVLTSAKIADDLIAADVRQGLPQMGTDTEGGLNFPRLVTRRGGRQGTSPSAEGEGLGRSQGGGGYPETCALASTTSVNTRAKFSR